MLGRIFIFFLSALLCSNLFSQDRHLDSLEKVLLRMPNDSNKVNLLNTVAWTYIQVDIEKAKKYSEESIHLAEKLNYKNGLPRAVIIISNIYFNQGNYEKSLELNLRGLKLREEQGDEHGVAGALGNIGSVYQMMRQINKALEYHLKSLEKFQVLYNKKPNDDDAFDIGVCRLSIGEIYKNQNKLDSSMKYFSDALSVFTKLNHRPNIAASLAGISETYFRMHKDKEAIGFALKALDIYAKDDDKYGMSNVYLNLSNIELESGNYDKAIDYANKSLAAAKEISYTENFKNAYELLAMICEKKGNYK